MKNYKIGDTVKLKTGKSGTVIDLKDCFLTIKDEDGKVYKGKMTDAPEIKGTYTIPVSILQELRDYVKTLMEHGADITFEEKGRQVIGGVQYVEVYVSVIERNLEWDFVGFIYHPNDGGLNRIRTINSQQVPEKFYTAKANCDHCNLRKEGLSARKNTYLVKNMKTGEFKQVGSTCLVEYTGLNADLMSKVEKFIDKLTNNNISTKTGGTITRGGDDRRIAEDVKMAVYAMMKNTGKYSFLNLGDLIEDYLNYPETFEKYSAEIENINKWAESKLSDKSKITWERSSGTNVIKLPSSNLNAIISVIGTYLKNEAKIKRLESHKNNANYIKNAAAEYVLSTDNVNTEDFKEFMLNNPEVSSSMTKEIDKFINTIDIENLPRGIRYGSEIWQDSRIDEDDYYMLLTFVKYFKNNGKDIENKYNFEKVE